MTGQISPLTVVPVALNVEGPAKKIEVEVPFTDHLQNALEHTDRLQKEADQAALNLVSGDLENLHGLMIASEQAQLSLQLTVQVVNKVIQAYQEIYRMQI